jgi:hypothetical protein
VLHSVQLLSVLVVGAIINLTMYTTSTVGPSPCLCSCVADRSMYVEYNLTWADGLK